MSRRDFREKTQPLVMIIPMIDIMLFLLVFFMISMIYMAQTNTLTVNLPKSTSAKQETRPNVVPITVTETGEVLFDKELVTEQQLTEKIRTAIAQDKKSIFIVRGDSLVRYKNVVAVFDLLKKSGVRRVSIATEIKQ